MIIGIGNDLIEIVRIEKAIEREGFVEKYFTPSEQALFEQRHFNPGTVGGNFSVKEAVSKALGTGFRTFDLKDIEVLRDADGKPYVQLYNGAKLVADTLGISAWHVTIAHSKKNISAVAIGEKL